MRAQDSLYGTIMIRANETRPSNMAITARLINIADNKAAKSDVFAQTSAKEYANAQEKMLAQKAWTDIGCEYI